MVIPLKIQVVGGDSTQDPGCGWWSTQDLGCGWWSTQDPRSKDRMVRGLMYELMDIMAGR